MATITPVFTDNVAVVAAATLARGSTTRGTIDLRTKFGAYLFPKIARTGTTALSGGTTPGVDCLIRRVLDNDGTAAGDVHPVGTPALLSSIAAPTSYTVSTQANSGQAVLLMTATAGFSAGDVGAFIDSGVGVVRLEFARISLVTLNTSVTFDRNLNITHTVNDLFLNKADVFAPVWVPGGSLWEVVFDYGDDTAGSTVAVQCKAQTYDSETVA